MSSLSFDRAFRRRDSRKRTPSPMKKSVGGLGNSE